jgi:hypothetical protein
VAAVELKSAFSRLPLPEKTKTKNKNKFTRVQLQALQNVARDPLLPFAMQ